MALPLVAGAVTPVTVDYDASVWVNASTGDLAPYMIGSWNYGRITGANGVWQTGRAEKRMTLDRRFNWGAGVEYALGYGTAADYARYEPTAMWGSTAVRQAPARLQQLYAELKYRGVYITAGMKERHSGIVDDALSSGDLTRSNNSRPIPGVGAGFVDFQNIPFTNGWVQIDGEIMYGRMTDGSFRDKTFNHFSGLVSDNLNYTYKRCYFRTKPSQPLSVTVGMQTAGIFGGSTTWYRAGKVTRTENRGFHVKDIFKMFFPTEGGEDYYAGSSLGSWDFKARYAFRSGAELNVYFEWPWEDGSGIGRRNGWDGVWGVQYNFARRGWVDKVLFEWVDFTNQGGPIHFSHTDYAGTTIDGHATGGDDYYNNSYYGPYSNYGMSIGTPFVVSPLYNLGGEPEYIHNRARGFHAAVAGTPAEGITYTFMVGWQQAGGSGRQPARRIESSTSARLACRWVLPRMPELSLRAEVAFDAGKLRGDNFGMLAGVTYSGNITFAKDSK